MNLNIYYELDGHTPRPCSIERWSDCLAQIEERRVARTVLPETEEEGEVEVSTVFLGLDHRHFGEGPPILFETMVFGGPLDGSQDRYCTWEEAEAGHAAMLARVRGEAP